MEGSKKPKKRGRKPKPKSLEDERPKIPKKRGRKPKGGKIITENSSKHITEEIKPNIILHLKCKLNDIIKCSLKPK